MLAPRRYKIKQRKTHREGFEGGCFGNVGGRCTMRRAVLMDNTLVARLAEHRTLGGAPPEELAWLASHGQLRHVEPGERIARRAEILDTMVILLSGHITIQVDRGLGPRKVMEWGAGDVSGFLPYSRMGKPPGDDSGLVEKTGERWRRSR